MEARDKLVSMGYGGNNTSNLNYTINSHIGYRSQSLFSANIKARIEMRLLHEILILKINN